MEEFVILDKTYLPEMVKLYKSAFSGALWNDDWSDEEQLTDSDKPAYDFYHKNGFKDSSKHVSLFKGF